jgi:Flp pilus assembly protein TadG
MSSSQLVEHVRRVSDAADAATLIAAAGDTASAASRAVSTSWHEFISAYPHTAAQRIERLQVSVSWRAVRE